MKKISYSAVAVVLVLSFSLVTAVPALAAPIVASVTETAFGTDTTDHNVNMPATVNAGDLLIVLFTNDGSATVTTPDGWSSLASNASGTAVRLSVYYKIAAGTEGGTTVNFVTSAAEQAAAQVYRITDWNGSTPPEISAATAGTSPSPNPPVLDPAGWDVADTLWLAVAGQDRGDQEGTTTYPASYTDGTSTLSSDVLGNCRTLSARRVHATASENPGAFTIPQDEEWVAFTIAVRPLSHSLTISSTAGGSVTTPGEGVFTYDEGTVVDLVAVPDPGYRFVMWTGDVGTVEDVLSADTTITMDGDYAVTANFVARYDLSISISSTDGGHVIEPGEGVFTYDEGRVVDLVAIPDAGYRFVEWTGDVGTIADVHDATTTITMNGDYAITANFVAIYDLTTNSTEGGSVTTPGEGVFTYDEGTVVNLVATPDAGYRFVVWTGDVSTIADVHNAATTITMNGDYSITANFVAIYDLTISSTEGGSVTTPGEGVFTYDKGTVVNLVATPDAGYRFIEWTGDVGTIADVHDASTTIIINGNYTIIANFIRATITYHSAYTPAYGLTISSTQGGSVTTPGEGLFPYVAGTVVSLVAGPDEGYRFVEWTGDVGTIADVHDASTTIAMLNWCSITANFAELPSPPVYPTVTTQPATNISSHSAILNMSYTTGDFNPVEVRFAYKKSSDTTWSYTAWAAKSKDGTHAECLAELSSNTRYEFKAQLKGGEIVEGATLLFTTDRSSVPPPSGSGAGSRACFIATAAYGTPTAEQIDVLREFRDVVLMKSAAGSQFVSLYYRLSPPVADFIAGHEVVRTVVRELVIDPIVWLVQASGGIWRN